MGSAIKIHADLSEHKMLYPSTVLRRVFVLDEAKNIYFPFFVFGDWIIRSMGLIHETRAE